MLFLKNPSVIPSEKFCMTLASLARENSAHKEIMPGSATFSTRQSKRFQLKELPVKPSTTKRKGKEKEQ